MKEAIKNFPNQLRFEPIIENKKTLISTKNFVVCGMGGSHLAADLLKTWNPLLNLIIHHDYGLPVLTNGLNNYLIIISSYSGNTEEAIDGFHEAITKKLPVACISTGGKLLELAIKYKKPYIKIPDTGIEPRSALGFSMVSLLKLMKEEQALLEIKRTADIIDMNKTEKEGEILAKKLKDFTPIIYASTKNEPVAYNWKIRFNETGKIPAFYNTFPELNHNEMVGFDGEKKTEKLLKNFYFIFLKDKADHPRILLRMEILKELLKKKGFPVEILEFEGKNIWEKVFSSLLIADWATYYIAQQYGLKAQETEIINNFKNTIEKKGQNL
ncbi:bifunctional phosphoglucose/phosphomannose isomerase [Patescibacteria group bacterium]|nr:bifunctional phosphoglucose/phosphomannose isomerase [Patescibacteria group bacterium]